MSVQPRSTLDVESITSLIDSWIKDATLSLSRTIRQAKETDKILVLTKDWPEVKLLAESCATHLEDRAARIRRQIEEAKKVLTDALTDPTGDIVSPLTVRKRQ